MASRLRHSRLYRRISDFIIRVLVKEHGTYSQRFPNDIDKLRACLRPGDVILVEGSQRISQIIKYLTQSSWSHASLFVGDAVIKRGGQHADLFRAAYGDDASALLIEANVETGVTAVPLSKYKNHNLRICRPINLRPGDLATVLNTVVSQLGNKYSVGHIVDLLRYFFPISLIGLGGGPIGAQAGVENLGDDVAQDVICSSQIAMAFQKVRYPIQPTYTQIRTVHSKTTVRRWVHGAVSWRRYTTNMFETGVFTPCDPRLVTPRDFDLSPYFEVVKLPTHDRRDFDYKKLKWSQTAEATAATADTSSGRASQPIDRLPETEPAIP